MQDDFFLVVGLGNPGQKYINNRHNIGHLCIDYLYNNYKSFLSLGFKNKFKSDFARIKIKQQEIIIIKPNTFMNLSGDSVKLCKDFFKIPNQNIIVIHDELDLSFARIKRKLAGGNAGHNGLKDISKKIGNDYHRIRVGIEHPRNLENPNIPVASYVLSDFNNSEQNKLNDIYQEVAQEIINLSQAKNAK